ncbi:hypothetical protein GALMADRAFT_77028, partial [Galerina marginata CBS 339.88]
LGMYLISFFNCIHVLVWSDRWFKPRHHVKKAMLLAALLMLVFASMDVAFHLRHVLDAFIYFNGDPIETFDKTSNWINVMKMGCFVAQTFVGDSILIYRCWIVYDRNWLVVALPIALTSSACGVMTIHAEATLHHKSGRMLNSPTLVPFITSMLCLTLATNVITTCMCIGYNLRSWTLLGLIVHRICAIRNSLKRRSVIVVSTSRLTSVVVVLIESGLMYTLSIIILFVLYMTSNNAQYGVSNAVVQIIGITFNLIIVSVGRGDATASIAHHSGSCNNQEEHHKDAPLHMINIQTSVSTFHDPTTPVKSGTDVENASTRPEWDSRPR